MSSGWESLVRNLMKCDYGRVRMRAKHSHFSCEEHLTRAWEYCWQARSHFNQWGPSHEKDRKRAPRKEYHYLKGRFVFLDFLSCDGAGIILPLVLIAYSDAEPLGARSYHPVPPSPH